MIEGAPVYSSLKLSHNQRLDAVVYSGSSAGTNASTFALMSRQKLTGTWEVEQRTLPKSMIVSNIIGCGQYVYISGYLSSNSESFYTYFINLESDSSELIELSGYITQSSSDSIRIIARTSDAKLYVLEGTQVFVIENVNASCFWDQGNNNILCSHGEDSQSMALINYNRLHNLQINKLVDEFNNTCLFDFKNIVKVTQAGNQYFFNHNFEDYSLSGNVKNFTQSSGNDLIILKSGFTAFNTLENISVIGDIAGHFEFPLGARNITFGDTLSECSFANLSHIITNHNAKWIIGDHNSLTLSEFNTDSIFST